MNVSIGSKTTLDPSDFYWMDKKKKTFLKNIFFCVQKNILKRNEKCFDELFYAPLELAKNISAIFCMHVYQYTHAAYSLHLVLCHKFKFTIMSMHTIW